MLRWNPQTQEWKEILNELPLGAWGMKGCNGIAVDSTAGADESRQTDKGIVLATVLVQSLRSQSILLPSVNVIERICAEAVTRANRRLLLSLTERLTELHRRQLNALLGPRDGSKASVLAWLRQSPSAPNAKHLLEHVDRLTQLRALNLPDGVERQVHQNRLLKLAREGGQMTSQHLRDLEPARRFGSGCPTCWYARPRSRCSRPHRWCRCWLPFPLSPSGGCPSRQICSAASGRQAGWLTPIRAFTCACFRPAYKCGLAPNSACLP